MIVKIGLIGARGKMGNRVALCAVDDPKFSIAWELTSKRLSDEPLDPVDVIIDFSSSKALLINLTLAINSNCPIVIGTTGLTKEDHLTIKEAAFQIPIFWTPNFSLGMAAMTYLTEKLSFLLKNFTPHITETHHIHKKDSPSGSALAIQEALHSEHKKRSEAIESIRTGEVIGKHQISFSGKYETITLAHEVHSRDAFAKGALEAAAFLIEKPAGLYNMSDLLSIL